MILVFRYELLLQEKGILAGKGETIGADEWDLWNQGVAVEANQRVCPVTWKCCFSFVMQVLVH